MLSLGGLPIYYQNPIGRLYEHPDGYLVVDYNAGKRLMSEYRPFVTRLMYALQRNGWHKMLTNQRQMAPFTEEERAWLVKQWLGPDPAWSGHLTTAVLLPEDVFARLAVNTIMHDVREGALLYRVFTDAQDATAWLRGVA